MRMSWEQVGSGITNSRLLVLQLVGDVITMLAANVLADLVPGCANLVCHIPGAIIEDVASQCTAHAFSTRGSMALWLWPLP